MKRRSQLELAHLLGESFARRGVRRAGRPLARARARRARAFTWCGSSERAPERLPPFDEVEKLVRADWLTQSRRAACAPRRLSLLPRYQISLPPELRQTLATAPGAGAVPGRAR